MSAIKVISTVMIFLKKQLLDIFSKSYNIKEFDACWVIIVPVFLHFSARQLIRKAAVKVNFIRYHK